MAVLNPFDFFLEPYAENFPFAYDPALRRDLAPYLEADAADGHGSRSTWHAIPRTEVGTVDFLVDLNQRLAARHPLSDPPGARRADPGADAGAAHRLVPRLRVAAGAAAAPPGPRGTLRLRLPDPARGRREVARRALGPGADFTDLHAWCEVYLPGAGWIGLDPTSGLLAGEGHIPLACTPEPSAAAPITGASRNAKVEFEHRHARRADLRGAARHHALYRRAVGADRGARPRDRRRTRRAGRAPDHGRRAHLRLHRRSGRRRVEHRRAGPEQAPARRPTCITGCATATRPAACCTSARASGIRASRCRAGR